MKQKTFDLINEGIKRVFYLIPKYPKVAQIEITNRCNFNCLMCQRKDLKVPFRDMDFALYEKIISKLGKVEELILTGWGEPLMHPNIVQMIKLGKKSGRKVSLTSNGSILKGKLARDILNCELDSISFSIDEVIKTRKSKGHPLSIQINNIELFVKSLRKENKKTEVIIQTTLHENSNLDGVAKWASAIKADMININRLDVRFNKNLVRPDISEEIKITKMLKKISDEYGIRVDFKTRTAFSGLARNFYSLIIPLLHEKGKHCLRIFDYVYVNIEGKITPCCG